jgi:hypothetical protein
VVAPLAVGEEASSLDRERAMDGVKTRSDGRWQDPKVATRLLRRLPAQPQEPTRGTVVARHAVGGATVLIVKNEWHNFRAKGSDVSASR